MKTTVTPQIVAHIAQLAHIPVSIEEQKNFAGAFEETLGIVDTLSQLNVSQIPTTHQVTGLENVWREDAIDNHAQFTQQEALANGAKTHNGYFVVERILEEKDA